MKRGQLKEVTGRAIKGWYDWLKKEDAGCCSLCYASDDKYNYCVVMGWAYIGEGHYEIAWEIGRQTLNSAMQCDFDVDFELPSSEDGDVDDTRSVLDPVPSNILEWSAIAKVMRDEARRVYEQWKEESE